MEFFASLPRHYVRADLPEGSYLISAASFWDREASRFILPKVIPPRRYFMDSGAYTFPFGVPYTWDEYAEFCRAWSPVFVATLDVFCSPAGTARWVEQNIDKVLLSGLPVIPVVTGRTPSEFRWCLDRIRDAFGVFMPRHVAVGGLKQNANAVATLSKLLESGMRYHLFGASVRQLQAVPGACRAQIASVDSGNWNGRFGKQIEVCNRLMKERGWTQREVALLEFLPKYRERISEVLSSEKAQ